MKRTIQAGSLSSVLMMAMTWPALAQTAPAQPAGDAAQQAPQGIAEVIVTAQRFSESAQKAPVVISVISPAQMQGISDVRQLQTVDPGVQLGTFGGTPQTFIRGVGSIGGSATQEGAIAYNADGVFLFTGTMVTPLMYDLDRIEVLKGPQGTLYGRNASGGAINLITAGASFGKTEGYVEGELGDYGLKHATGAINLPLTPTLAIRLAGQYIDHNGYLSDGAEDANVTAGRIRLLWEPSPDVSLKIGADISTSDANGNGTSVNPNPTSDKFVGALDPRLNTGPFFLGGYSLLSAPPNPPPYYKNDQWSANAQLDVKLGSFATLTLLPAYRHEHMRTFNYVPGYVDFEQPRTNQKSMEARLANRTDTLKWVVGAYYIDVNQSTPTRIRNESNSQDVSVSPYKLKTEAYAFFGEATYSLADRLRVIGGLRYTHERTKADGLANARLGPPGLPNPQTDAYNPFNPFTNPTGEFLDYPIHNSSVAKAVSWKIGAEFDVTPSSLLFATASRGFKGGGAYADVPGVDSSFRPEYLTAFELGSRNRFLDNTLQINGELFYWKLKDQQIPYVGFNSIAQVTYLTANAGQAHMYGGNVDVVWQATPDDTLSAAVEYNKSKYDTFTRLVPSLAVLTTTRCQVTGYAGPISLAPATVDCAGLPLLRAPKWAGSASYEHRFDLGGAGAVLANVNVTYASARYMSPAYTAYMYQKSSAFLNAALTYTTADGTVSVSGWIRNIANVRVMSGGEEFVTLYARPSLQPPRTMGVSARYNF